MIVLSRTDKKTTTIGKQLATLCFTIMSLLEQKGSPIFFSFHQQREAELHLKLVYANEERRDLYYKEYTAIYRRSIFSLMNALIFLSGIIQAKQSKACCAHVFLFLKKILTTL